jgi:hypothetical protein
MVRFAVLEVSVAQTKEEFETITLNWSPSLDIVGPVNVIVPVVVPLKIPPSDKSSHEVPLNSCH